VKIFKSRFIATRAAGR